MEARRPHHLVRLGVRNHRSLRDVDLLLSALNVLVGPNGSGESTLLDVVVFLADCARLDLQSAVDLRGGCEKIRFRDASDRPWTSVETIGRLVVLEDEVATVGGAGLTTSRPREDLLDPGAHLLHLAEHEPGVFQQLQCDACLVVPGLRDIVFRPTPGAVEGRVTQPVELLRAASQRTQLLVTTHSPVLVNSLRADELVVCERDADGASRIPAIAAEGLRRMEETLLGEVELGELWFTGALGGVPRCDDPRGSPRHRRGRPRLRRDQDLDRGAAAPPAGPSGGAAAARADDARRCRTSTPTPSNRPARRWRVRAGGR